MRLAKLFTHFAHTAHQHKHQHASLSVTTMTTAAATKVEGHDVAHCVATQTVGCRGRTNKHDGAANSNSEGERKDSVLTRCKERANCRRNYILQDNNKCTTPSTSISVGGYADYKGTKDRHYV